MVEPTTMTTNTTNTTPTTKENPIEGPESEELKHQQSAIQTTTSAGGSPPYQPNERSSVNGSQSQLQDDDVTSQRSGYSMQSRTNYSAIDSEVPLS